MTARVSVAAKVCEGCGRRFGRRQFPSGRLEDASRFSDRRFCSRVCYRAACAAGLRLRPPGEWLPAPPQLKSLTATLSDPENGARAMRPEGTPQRPPAPLRAVPGPRNAESIPPPGNPRPEETP